MVYEYDSKMEINVGRCGLEVVDGDVIQVIDDTRLRINTVLVAGANIQSLLNHCYCVGQRTMPEYQVLVQQALNKRHKLTDGTGELELPAFRYVDMNPLLAGVKIS